MSKFDSMDHAQLRAYVLAHREDEEAWEAFRKTLKDNPNVIRVNPNLDEAGWAQVEQLIKKKSSEERSAGGMNDSNNKNYLTEAQELGKRAIEQGLIPSFVVINTLGAITFYIPDEDRGNPLTIEQAHSQFKKLLGIS